MEKITEEMRKTLREPLPQEAVSPHPTKTYLSSIKSIYVAERINDVFGVGSWTLKSEVIQLLEKFVVVKAFLEIPEYGFYGEAYGGNDNSDIGDAYKGATTDGFTKIAAQQLEIGIDVFKGLGDRPKPKALPKQDNTPPTPEHWCKEHQTKFFKSAKMRSYAHPIKDSNEWCSEPAAPDKSLLPDAATIKKICSDAGMDSVALNKMVKERYGGLTWGKLSDEKKLEVLDTLKGNYLTQAAIEMGAEEIEPEDLPF